MFDLSDYKIQELEEIKKSAETLFYYGLSMRTLIQVAEAELRKRKEAEGSRWTN